MVFVLWYGGFKDRCSREIIYKCADPANLQKTKQQQNSICTLNLQYVY